jgi:hypothetical protein
MGHMRTRLVIIVCLGFFLQCICDAQVSSPPPSKWKTFAPLEGALIGSKLKLSHNSPEKVQNELFDSNLIRLIAKSYGLSDTDIATIRVAQAAWSTNLVGIYQIGKSEKAFEIMSGQLRNYLRAREEGHTKEFLLSALTNRMELSKISDPYLRAIAKEEPLIPVHLLKKLQSGTSTNKAGEVKTRTTTIEIINGKSITNETTHIPKVDEISRWAKYYLVDGEIGWEYFVRFEADGTFEGSREGRCDAKEFDPRFQQIIKDVEEEAHVEMKKDGSFGKLGSVHTFWNLKKEKLKAKGIEWRSPAELNPDTIYD